MPLSIGQQLKNARLDHNLTLEDVFKVTHIRIKYLEALEADDFSVMPSPAQGRGFLRLYAQHLDLDIDTLLAEMREAEAVEASFEKVGEISTEMEEIVEEELVDSPILPEERIPEPLWRQLLRRIGVTLASPEPAPGQEAEVVLIAEASLISAPDTAEAEPESAAELEEDVQLEPSQPPEESRIAFAKIGASLRERRELLSLTYEEIEGHIHLRPHYLAALEAGNLDTLPSPVQTRGMLSNYADFLDLDTDALLLRFAEGLQAQRLERHVQAAAQFESSTKKRRRFSLGSFVAPDLIFGITVVVLIAAFSIWGLGRIAKTRAENTLVEATAPSIAEVLMTTPTLEVEEIVTPTLIVVNTPGGEVGTPLPLDETITEEDIGVQILVTILERSWLRVTVDGGVVFEGRAQPNATFVYEGNESVEILTANGAGVRIAYNQQDLGLMGGFGEVVQRIYGVRGILTPTVTPTLPATETPMPTITPSPTLTPVSTPLD